MGVDAAAAAVQVGGRGHEGGPGRGVVCAGVWCGVGLGGWGAAAAAAAVAAAAAAAASVVSATEVKVAKQG